jgi:hypothetical protein
MFSKETRAFVYLQYFCVCVCDMEEVGIERERRELCNTFVYCMCAGYGEMKNFGGRAPPSGRISKEVRDEVVY